jgi:tRNA(His) 5'-end guanylyltransferase
MEDMDTAARALCENITGAQLAYVQSDEISILLTDFGSPQTEAWFNGSVQKLASLSASLTTAHFNAARGRRTLPPEAILACFDSRAFTIPDRTEVENYFHWRQQDAARNSVSMTAQAHFPHERLQGKSTNEMQEMLWSEKGVNWNDLPGGFKRGRCIVRRRITKDAEYQDKRTGGTYTVSGIERWAWEQIVPPAFTKDRNWLRAHIPQAESETTQ